MAGIIEVKDQGKLRIYDADNSHYVDIVVPSSVTANRTITIPDASFTVPQADTNTVGLTGVSTASGNVTITDGNLVLASGHGIDFAETGNVSGTSSELLDDYEEGTWSPVITGATSVTNLQGSYTKVGNLVTVWVQMLNGNVGGSPGAVITGLPFTVDESRSTTSAIASNLFAGNSTVVYGLLDTSATTISILYNRDSNSWLAQNIRTFTNGYLHFSASYIAN